MSVFTTKSIQFGAFLLYCLGKDKFLGANKFDNLCRFSFTDDTPGMSCKELEKDYFSTNPTPDIIATRDLIYACSTIRQAVIVASDEARKQNYGAR